MRYLYVVKFKTISFALSKKVFYDLILSQMDTSLACRLLHQRRDTSGRSNQQSGVSPAAVQKQGNKDAGKGRPTPFSNHDVHGQ